MAEPEDLDPTAKVLLVLIRIILFIHALAVAT